MATYTRQEVLERFNKVDRSESGIKESVLDFPCFVQRPVEPEPEDSSLDFELIQKLLEEQHQRK